MRTNQFDGAENSFKKAIQINPKALNAVLALGAFYQSRGRFPEAEQQFQTAIQTDPHSADPRAALARLYMIENKGDQAEQLLKQARKDFPDNSVGYRMLGDYYFATGNLDKA